MRKWNKCGQCKKELGNNANNFFKYENRNFCDFECQSKYIKNRNNKLKIARKGHDCNDYTNEKVYGCEMCFNEIEKITQQERGTNEK